MGTLVPVVVVVIVVSGDHVSSRVQQALDVVHHGRLIVVAHTRQIGERPVVRVLVISSRFNAPQRDPSLNLVQESVSRVRWRGSGGGRGRS